MVLITFWLVVLLTLQWWPIDQPLELAGRRLQPPSADHWLGTDALGRDVLSRTLHGVRYSLPVAVIVVAFAVLIGGFLGALAGFFGGIIDSVIMSFSLASVATSNSTPLHFAALERQLN